MTEARKKIRREFHDLIERKIVPNTIAFLRRNRADLVEYAVGGSTWIQYAIRYSDLRTIEALVDAGLDIHALNKFDDDNSLSCASRRGDIDIMNFCLSKKVEPLMEGPLGNPLFACMPGKIADTHPTHGKDTPLENYLTIAKMLIDYGVDTTARYDMSIGSQVDAMMLALVWGRDDIAQLIADHQADGDERKARLLLEEARTSVKALNLDRE